MTKNITRFIALVIFGIIIIRTTYLIIYGKNISISDWFTLAIAFGYYTIEYMSYKEKRGNNKS